MNLLTSSQNTFSYKKIVIEKIKQGTQTQHTCHLQLNNQYVKYKSKLYNLFLAYISSDEILIVLFCLFSTEVLFFLFVIGMILSIIMTHES